MVSDNAYPFLNELDVDQDVKRRLSIQLRRVELGNDESYVTPLGANDKYKVILSDLDRVFKENSKDIVDVLHDLEMSNREKIGPRSIASPWSVRKELFYESFGKDSTTGNLDIDIPPSTKSLRPIDYQKALNLLKNNTNSGLPYYTRKSKVKERVLKDFDVLIKRLYPCLLFTRTQEGGKTRNVWGYPIADTLKEMRYYAPLLGYQKNQSYRAALIGPDEVGRSVCELVLKAQDGLRTLASFDFGLYDQSVKRRLQEFAFSYIKKLFQESCASEIDEISSRFLNIGIVTPDGIINKPHGVPSGSTFTNEVDSIVQMLISVQLPFVNLENCQIQGDDGVYLIPLTREDELVRQFKSYGLSVNEEKTKFSQNYAIYLQCLYHIYYINKGIIGGIYPVYRALNRLCFQERWSDFEDYDIIGKDFYSIRAICILENCKHHPLFENLVKLIVKHDKYSLDFSSQGLSNYVHMMESTKGAEGILINQYGDDVKGIKSFKTYQLIKRLS